MESDGFAFPSLTAWAGARGSPSSTPDTGARVGGKTHKFRGHSVWLSQRSKIC